MFALLSISIIVASFVLLSTASIDAVNDSYEYKKYQDGWVIERVMKGVEFYYVENGIYPLAITAMDDTHLEPFMYVATQSDRFKYRVANTLTDGFWEFDRAAALYEDPKNTVDDFSANDPVFDTVSYNSCGTGTFDNDPDWCPRHGAYAVVAETREYANTMFGEVIYQLDFVLSKVAKGYSAAGQFPSFGLSIGNSQILASLAGYGGGPAGCQGSFSSQTIEFDCGDFYSVGGNQVIFNYLSPTHIAVTLRTEFKNSIGQNISISRELRAE